MSNEHPLSVATMARRLADALETLSKVDPGAAMRIPIPGFDELLDRMAAAGLVTSFAFGPMAGEPTPLWSVNVLNPNPAIGELGEFEKPYAATTIVQAALIAELEAQNRGWIK